MEALEEEEELAADELDCEPGGGVSRRHWLGAPVQAYPNSCLHALLQPSPSSRFPSSQLSGGLVTIPFPQRMRHALGWLSHA